MFKRKKGKSLLPILIILLVIFSLFSPSPDKPEINTSGGSATKIELNDNQIALAAPLESKLSTAPSPTFVQTSVTVPENKENNIVVEGTLEVHFIDVGQADSILIKTSTGQNMLIDAGNNSDENLVSTYLKNQNIKTIDVLVGTHPHEDHIGGLDAVINNFDVKQVYMPKVSHTTKTFEDVLLAIKNKGLKISTPTPGDTFNLGSAKLTILAPNNTTYNNLNDYSIIIKLEFGKNSFLFTGDAEAISENEIISKGYNLNADVLKVGHHGSDTSTTQAFLDKVNPKYAVVMVGAGNSYGHPTTTILEKLKTKNIELYRTDESGTIIFTTDGENITITKTGPIVAPAPVVVEAKPAEQKVTPQPSPPATDNVAEVYITKTGSKYHTSGCSYLSKSKIPISLAKAKSSYAPCSKCNPPK